MTCDVPEKNCHFFSFFSLTIFIEDFFWEREGLFWFGSVGSFFDIVVFGICAVDVFLSFLRIFGI